MVFNMDLFLNLAVETDELSLVKSVLECKHMNQHDIETVLTSMASKNLEIVILLFQAHSRLSPSVKDQQLRAVQTAFINNRFDLVELMFQHFPKLSPKVVKKLFLVSRSPEMDAALARISKNMNIPLVEFPKST